MMNVPIRLPLWYMVHTQRTNPDDILGGTRGDAKVALLFLAKDAAEQFVSPSPVYRAVAVSDLAELQAFLDGLDQRGFTHVGIDLAGTPVSITVAELRRILSSPPTGGP
jgi:hypothetical protein